MPVLSNQTSLSGAPIAARIH